MGCEDVRRLICRVSSKNIGGRWSLRMVEVCDRVDFGT